MRLAHQQIWDKVGLLNLFHYINQYGQIEGNLKLQKLVFICELKGLQESLKPFYFRFFRYSLGPYSAELANEVKFLENAGFIVSTTKRLTRRGRYVLDYVKAAAGETKKVTRTVSIIKEMTRRYGRHSGDRLKKLVYGMEVPVYDLGGRIEKVENIPLFLDILNPTGMRGASLTQAFDRRLMQDLAEEFAITEDDLKPESPVHRQIVSAAIQRITRQYQPTS